MNSTQPLVSVVIPAKNEAASLPALLQQIAELRLNVEVIVVDDGSSDETQTIAERAGARVIRHRYSMGNGAAVKAGAREARGETLVFMDADGQHQPADIPALLARLAEGYDMAVAKRGPSAHASFFRRLANGFYNRLASWISNVPIGDLTSGFRAAQASKFRDFLPLLPNGFSYPTTITMAFLRSGYSVAFEPVSVLPREGGTKSHIRPVRDGARFLLIIFKLAMLYSPLKLFAPASASIFAVATWYYAYTYITEHRLTNMGTLLMVVSAMVFFIGLISEQITMLMYAHLDRRK